MTKNEYLAIELAAMIAKLTVSSQSGVSKELAAKLNNAVKVLQEVENQIVVEDI